MELIAAVLLLTPRFVWAGAALAMAATGGAVVSHLTFLGIEVQGDKGLLFFLAGGPGVGATEIASRLVRELGAILEDRDLVLVDRRANLVVDLIREVLP